MEDKEKLLSRVLIGLGVVLVGGTLALSVMYPPKVVPSDPLPASNIFMFIAGN